MLIMRHCLIKSLIFLLPGLVSGKSLAAPSEDELLQQLRADYVVLLQARTEFEQLYAEKEPGNYARNDFSSWISQLSGQVADGCRQLSLISTKPLPADLPCDQILSSRYSPALINLETESTEVETTAKMIDELNGSLGEFDERLLREQDRIKEKKPRTESDSSSSGGGASGGQGDAAADSDGEEGPQGQASEEKTASGPGSADRTGSTEEGQPGSSNEKGILGKSSQGKKSSAPADIPDGSNDDVIARQLREAAEKEKDPELKKKLWDEYRRYKSGEL